jgi:hypothetical protein
MADKKEADKGSRVATPINQPKLSDIGVTKSQSRGLLPIELLAAASEEQIINIPFRPLDRVLSIVSVAALVGMVALYRPYPTPWNRPDDGKLEAPILHGKPPSLARKVVPFWRRTMTVVVDHLLRENTEFRHGAEL